jgi:hypothetical protein
MRGIVHVIGDAIDESATDTVRPTPQVQALPPTATPPLAPRLTPTLSTPTATEAVYYRY